MKIFLDFIGCRLNESEIESMAQQFHSAGHTLVDNAVEADLVVVNTCSVTANAASDSRQKIRQAARIGNARIVVTGCWATLEPENAASLPAVISVIPNIQKDILVPSTLGINTDQINIYPNTRQLLPGLHSRTRAFIKVQDGCDNHCTFCITRIARGHSRSRPIDNILIEIQAALNSGVKEVVLTGVHLASWGQDFTPQKHLYDLIEKLLSVTDVPRLRISSLEPWDLEMQFFNLWHDKRLCQQLHIPLQSGCSATLQRMGRKISPTLYSDLIENARKIVPEIAITTDIIVGFPGESDSEFAESIEFVKQMHFARGHVFTFSPRPGTAANQLPHQVPGPIAKTRSHSMRNILSESLQIYNQHFLGRQLSVLWESVKPLDIEKWRLEGLSDNYLRISAESNRPLWNQISLVAIESVEKTGLKGKILINSNVL